MSYYAHSPKNGIPAQAYTEHVRGVRALAGQYAAEAGSFAAYDGEILQRLAAQIAQYHDMGKLDGENQKVLSGEAAAKTLPVNHADAGSAHWLRDESFSLYSAAVIHAHHKGFPDFCREQNKGNHIFRDPAIAEAVNKNLPEFEAIHKHLFDWKDTANAKEEVRGDLPVFLRMLLSCVADADHTDTAQHYGKYPRKKSVAALRPSERLEKLNHYIADLQKKGEASERNQLRNQMFLACRDADIHTGISFCDSPVGAGKTTAVMAHLLAQAKERGLRRIFIVLPFTNIIQQSVDVYREAVTLPGEDPKEVVAELHHRADFENEDMRQLSALWRAPIIVTTAVAFFETIASNSPAVLRRFHELPGSAVFVDESHAALPVCLLPVAWRWINILANEWSCYWVMASGSMCRFWKIEAIAGKSAPDNVSNIVDQELHDTLMAYESNRIVYCYDPQPKSTDELASWITAFSGPRIVILNTVQSAAALADWIAREYGRKKVEHLSTALKPEDREKTLRHIKSRLGDPADTDWTLVATSCVEAGVDFSFQCGFRELGALSSLLQAAGRINRNGKEDCAQIWTFRIREDGRLMQNPGLIHAGRVLKKFFEQKICITPQLTTRSITEEIALYGLEGKHQTLIDNEVSKNFRSIEHDFKVIDSDTRLAIVDAEIAKQLQSGMVDWHKLQNASVQIAKYKLEELKIQPIMPDIYWWDRGYNEFLGYMAGIIPQDE